MGKLLRGQHRYSAWISASSRRSFIDGSKMSLLGWMAAGLSSSQTMLPKSCPKGQVFKHHNGVEREDEVVMGKEGKGSCPIDCTHCRKQGFGGGSVRDHPLVPLGQSTHTNGV